MTSSAPVTNASVGTHLRMQLPTPIARGLEAAVSPIGQPGERLSRRIAFVERLLRFMVAVQEPLRAHLGLERPGAVRDLLRRLDRPTLGLWGQASVALSTLLATRCESRLAQALGESLHTGAAPSDLFLGCDGLIEIRNRVAHSADLACLPVDDAHVWLERTRAPLRQLIRGLGPLCSVELVVPTLETQSLLGRTHLQLLRYRGLTPVPLELTDAGARPPVELPMLVDDDGTLVPLYPWLVHRRKAASGALCSVARWDDRGPIAEGLATDPRPLEQVPSEVAALSAAEGMPKLQPPMPSRWKLAHGALQALRAPPPGADAPPKVRDLVTRELLGRGGAGTVWAVEDPSRPSTPLALKVLHPRLVQVPGAVERLRREFDLLKSLSASGLVHVEELIEDPDVGPCLLMERIDGESLATILARGPMEPDRAVSLIVDVLQTLAHVHRHGVVHRDLKPSNIMLTGEQTRLLDFGVARLAEATSLTRTGDLIGTRNYAAPEQLDGETATHAVDLYAMGLVLADLIKGGRSGAGGLPGHIAPVVRRATSRQPVDRYATALEMAHALQAARKRDSRACALLAGERLSGGLRLEGVPRPVGDHLFVLSASTPSGKPAAILAPSSERSACALLFRLRDQVDAPTLHRWTRSRVQTTDDGVPWVELADAPAEDAAAYLLHTLDVTGGKAPPESAEPATPDPDPETAEGASKPTDGAATATVEQKQNSGVAQLGLLAAGALAGAVLASSPKARSAVARAPLAMPGFGGLAGLFGMMASTARKKKAKARARVAPRSSSPLENIHHRWLSILALEESLQETPHIDDALWQGAWKQPMGGLLAVLNVRWTVPPVVRPRLMATSSWSAMAGVLQRLDAGGAPSTADVATATSVFNETLRGFSLPHGREARAVPWTRGHEGGPLIRCARVDDGWQAL